MPSYWTCVRFLEQRQRRIQLRLRLVPRTPVGQQPAQLLVADRLVELVLDLPAQLDPAAQVGLGGPQRTDGLVATLARFPRPMARFFLSPLLLVDVVAACSNNGTARRGWPLRL